MTIRESFAAALRLAPGGRLVDLGCGRGGIGLGPGRELGVAGRT